MYTLEMRGGDNAILNKNKNPHKFVNKCLEKRYNVHKHKFCIYLIY